MSELIERLEAAEAGSRELDAEIAVATLWPALGRIKPWVNDVRMEVRERGNIGFKDLPGNPSEWSSPEVTTSLDAALALAERVLPGCCPGVSHNVHSGVWFSWLGYSEEGEARLYSEAFGKTAAVSLCISILKAKETK